MATTILLNLCDQLIIITAVFALYLVLSNSLSLTPCASLCVDMYVCVPYFK